jgi:hypothetical protein
MPTGSSTHRIPLIGSDPDRTVPETAAAGTVDDDDAGGTYLVSRRRL